ncbi:MULTISPECIES: hydroxyisourate hydrolase [Pseudomonas]|uniref:hydroxyisourate hydrolase n=1 Tax=Pseudomonas TaxID=286 RepID=UPI000D82014E|nr:MULTISPECIES: hydroxyisourate hydrolase [Pseudomonas]MBS7559492.1 hydroxyisourate hydrolase [Pseudomonas sp. RC4D1]MCY7260450.1 hydroxyisourate hydrolase [Pseudomonas protegens]NMY72109.1 hydroxyisourate hydrolase [Pseudomonas sp. WS 5414]PYC10134.1 5-hydroxyisourate hydrolase [Pseudomonas protegens]
MNGGVSIHVVDVASGKVAAGMQVRVRRLGEEWLCEGQIADNGLLAPLSELAARFDRGVYEVELDVAAFYRQQGQVLPTQPFLDVLVYRFGLDDPRQHYHLPFKLTAWGVSCFRGGA